jgi:hypothetical protein
VAAGQSGVSSVYDRATARLVLARALTQAKRDFGRARLLAEQARDGFAKLHDQPRLEEASAVLARIP